jgi:hypothetical protein
MINCYVFGKKIFEASGMELFFCYKVLQTPIFIPLLKLNDKFARKSQLLIEINFSCLSDYF